MTISELGKRFKSYFGFNPPIDMLMTMAKGPQKAVLDIIKLDEMLATRDSDYNPDTCTYKGKKNVSMGQYIELKYGREALQFVENQI